MIKPFPTHDSSERGSSFSRRPILLAKLPHVGTPVGRGFESTTVKPFEPEQPAVQAPGETSPYAHVYIDRSHQTAESANVLPSYDGKFDRPVTAQAESSGPRTYFRQDDTHVAGPRTHLSGGSRHQSTGSGGILQMQSLISSNSGLIVSLALTASAILLLLTIVNPPEPSLDPQGDGFEMYGSSPTDIPQFDHSTETSDVTGQKSNDEPLDLFASDPREEANCSEQEAEEADQFDWNDAFHAAQKPASEPLSARPVQSVESASTGLQELPEVEAAAEEDPIAAVDDVLPDTVVAKYPKTEYPEFDLSQLRGIVEEQFDPATSELSELPLVPPSDTLSR